MDSDNYDLTPDEILEKLGELVKGLDITGYITDSDKLRHIDVYSSVLKYCILTGCDIKTHIHEPFYSDAYISIIGDEIDIVDTKLFAYLCKKASSFEVYPLVNGKVQSNIGFDGIARQKRGVINAWSV